MQKLTISTACFLAMLVITGCGDSRDARNRAIEDGVLAGRWAGTQYTVATFATHCAHVSAGEDGARRSAIRKEVRRLVRAASLSTTAHQRDYSNTEIEAAADALACEPALSAQLLDALR